MTALMLVSANAGPSLRRAVADGDRPGSEYLQLERCHGVELFDLSQVAGAGGGRSAVRSLRHVAAAIPRLRDADVVLCDGEHLGIPLAVAMRTRRIRVPLVVIGHHLTTPVKAAAFRRLRAHRGMTRILVHSESQRDAACEHLGISEDVVRVVPYGVDLGFWRPMPAAEEHLIVAPGREHRDLATVAAALARLDARILVTGFSPHSSRARRRRPETWPANFTAGPVDILTLRDLCARAAVVVVPVLPADFPAGITSVLEAMAMGKAVVVSATRGLDGIVEHGRTGMLVRPGDARGLAATVEGLLADPGRRAQLGAQARREAEARFGLDAFAGRLASELREAGAAPGRGR